ncbi:hypothetical protein HK097_008537 [Rhizophlyctis rosea]|uniref:Corrinoid adenosyltransferase MMAB n=1 Tax=Rhizophlyctis rosea TaxID=64517 RepID=A0AAD5X4I0_9FUNG|nr:hypothetical protein HK097_008537 [Rhizophlyctis rosea]
MYNESPLIRWLSPSSAESTRRIKVYTRTGDKGQSSLFTGERRPKNDAHFEALGDVDELTSLLGVAREYCNEANNGLTSKLEKIQCLLQDVNSNVATPRTKASDVKLARTEFDIEGYLVTELESWIDELDTQLPPLQNFILPSGGKAASTLHVARAVCRRAERHIVPFVQEEKVDQSVGKYINRLSDFLFTAARFAAKHEGREETIYKKVERGKSA